MGGMGAHGNPGRSCVAFVFTLLLVGYSIWDLDQLSGPGVSRHYSLAPARVAPVAVLAGVASGGSAGTLASEPGPSSPRPGQRTPARCRPARGGGPADGQGRGVLAPWVAVSCRIAMGITMAFMLVIII